MSQEVLEVDFRERASATIAALNAALLLELVEVLAPLATGCVVDIGHQALIVIAGVRGHLKRGVPSMSSRTRRSIILNGSQFDTLECSALALYLVAHLSITLRVGDTRGVEILVSHSCDLLSRHMMEELSFTP